ncbi:DNA replication/repair protein RecF [Altererythrobacter sp.]|uniref:DNA replication/repair protein RecF n=1 Tax=Altererythrobacter sp. TaxID=1872480 RepID=UPI001B0086EA|nr:DNA replication/repair protein RecF [Altererythrobacter sp.]MBO6608596.1 DNA replication/repair protein RecF [Altererythrobacter sp.]MBO6642849.1 DNA replication/repair protein RecF [Altererythrobacter sp.]MBO6709592.1 DNA replication/repair protein RecF [Altererythrobacter sp.]
MALDRIALSHFRNHRQTELRGTAQLNLLWGENGAGKTNILEALSLLAPGRGLRRAPLGEMCGPLGQGGFQIGASLIEQGHESARIGTYVDAERLGRRLVRVNGAETSAQSLSEWIAIGWLTPAMDGLFMDSAGARRRYMDRLALALRPDHARHVSRYETALRERNKLLEENREATWLDAIEAQVAEHGTMIGVNRAALVATLTDELTALPDAPFAKPNLTYLPGGPEDREELRAELARTRGRDRAAGRTLTGPHRDELDVVMAGTGQAALSCSTGEQKAMLIALTLAHAVLAAEGRPSVLLLDEVAAHLDPVRRTALFERLRLGRAQVWLTGTEPSPFEDILGEAAVWRISDGAAIRV